MIYWMFYIQEKTWNHYRIYYMMYIQVKQKQSSSINYQTLSCGTITCVAAEAAKDARNFFDTNVGATTHASKGETVAVEDVEANIQGRPIAADRTAIPLPAGELAQFEEPA